MSTVLSPLTTVYEFEKILQWQRIHNPGMFASEDLEKKITEQARYLEKKIAIKPHKHKLVDSLAYRFDTLTQLKAKMRENFETIRHQAQATQSKIVPRIQAHNRKWHESTIGQEQFHRANVVSAQVRAWKNLLPTLIQKFSRIPDPRRTKSVKHSITVLMMFGLLAFVFHLSSRREMNRELTRALFQEHLKKLFPELNSIPHADTLERLLEKINPLKIEGVMISLIQSLIRKKKFKKLLIQNCLPITVDGVQKLYRNELLQDPRWCEREVSQEKMQQYIYVVEVNITLKNGLTIPLMTEYLSRSNNQLDDHTDMKQDAETTAFERMIKRLKHYFKRQKIIIFSDAMYATQDMMELIHQNRWEFMINLPRNKLKDFAQCLNKKRSTRKQIPQQTHYRERQQEFYWENYVDHKNNLWQMPIHLVGCLESYDGVSKKTGGIEKHYSDHAWISSIPININNAHELCNLGARKKELIEDSINTEKNRGYHYKHAFSYHWNAIQGFHYLMRLAHAVNAISEFSKQLKKYIRSLGSKATFKFIKETIMSPWLPMGWYEDQRLKPSQLCLQLE